MAMDLSVSICKVALAAGLAMTRQAGVKNVSTGGALLEMDSPQAPLTGDVLEVALNVAAREACCRRQHSLKARGIVTRSRQCPHTGRQLVAVAFFLPPQLAREYMDVSTESRARQT